MRSPGSIYHRVVFTAFCRALHHRNRIGRCLSSGLALRQSASPWHALGSFSKPPAEHRQKKNISSARTGVKIDGKRNGPLEADRRWFIAGRRYRMSALAPLRQPGAAYMNDPLGIAGIVLVAPGLIR
jgi:hypothetical protein